MLPVFQRPQGVNEVLFERPQGRPGGPAMNDWRVPKGLFDLFAQESGNFLGERDGEVGLLAPPTTQLRPMVRFLPLVVK